MIGKLTVIIMLFSIIAIPAAIIWAVIGIEKISARHTTIKQRGIDFNEDKPFTQADFEAWKASKKEKP